MKKPIGWTITHPMAAFFLLVLALMYIVGFPAVYLMNAAEHPLSQLLILYAGRLIVYGPVLAGIFITRWTRPEHSPIPGRLRWAGFGLVWLVALVVSALDLRRTVIEDALGWVPLLLISAPIALLPAFVVSSAFSRVASVREYLSTLVRPKGHLLWYVVALLAVPAFHLLGIAITQLWTGEPRLSDIRLTPEILWATLVTFAGVFFYSGGINEEGGWRGFAQRRLQGNYSPLVANLLLWAYLVAWHIPNDIIQYAEGNYFTIRIGLYPFITILMGWIYNQTQGSILAPVLFHSSMNAMNTLQAAFPMTGAAYTLIVLFSVFAVFNDRMWKRLPSTHPAVFSGSGNGWSKAGRKPLPRAPMTSR